MSNVPPGRFTQSVRKATVEEYKDWLMGYLANGGEPTHYYDRPFASAEFLILEDDAEIPALHGASAVKVIVPSYVTATNGGGHNDVYYMDGYRTNDIVPIYADIIQEVVHAFPDLFNPPTLSSLDLLYQPACVACEWEGDVVHAEGAARAACDDHADTYGDDHMAQIARVLVTDSGVELRTYY